MSSATRTVSAPDPLVSPVSSSKRYLAVDLLRGLTIAFMILVNDNGSERAFSALKHAEWNGFTPTDLVFPTFLFLVGASIVFSTESRLARGVTRASLFAHTVRRAIIIFLLGLVVNSAPFFRLSTMRYYGVLPRIALCYLIVASLYIWIRRPAGSAAGQPTVADKVGLLVACLLGYYLMMRFVPVPGFGVPGRDIPFLDHDANIVAWLDRQIFSAQHLYEHTRDPEGLLSTIPALGTTLIGVLTGLFLRSSAVRLAQGARPRRRRSQRRHPRPDLEPLVPPQQEALDLELRPLRRRLVAAHPRRLLVPRAGTQLSARHVAIAGLRHQRHHRLCHL